MFRDAIEAARKRRQEQFDRTLAKFVWTASRQETDLPKWDDMEPEAQEEFIGLHKQLREALIKRDKNSRAKD